MKYADWFKPEPPVSVRRLRAELEDCRLADAERRQSGTQEEFLTRQAAPPCEDWRERAFRRATGNR
jgi:hypothetical protein